MATSCTLRPSRDERSKCNAAVRCGFIIEGLHHSLKSGIALFIISSEIAHNVGVQHLDKRSGATESMSEPKFHIPRHLHNTHQHYVLNPSKVSGLHLAFRSPSLQGGKSFVEESPTETNHAIPLTKLGPIQYAERGNQYVNQAVRRSSHHAEVCWRHLGPHLGSPLHAM
jgi:hypothetical protein